MATPWQGESALVTGAGSGIGRAIARSLADAGARVLLLGRDAARLRATAADARGAEVVALDLAADAEAVAALAPRLPARLAVLVHAAGAHRLGPVEATDPAALDALLAVNLRAPLALTRLCLPALRAARGQVVFVNSSQGLAAGRGAGAYAASKHALRALADSLRGEVNAEGVRVLSVYPGRTATPLQAVVHAQEGRAYDPGALMQPEDVAAMVLAALTLPRTAEVTDIMMRPMRPPG